MKKQDTKACTFSDIKIEDVISVYSGLADHCCCGCSGKHTYASKHATRAGKLRGYAVTPDEVNDRSIKIIFGKMQRNAEKVKVEINKIDGTTQAALTLERRWYLLNV